MPARSAQQLEKLFDAKPVIVLKEMQTALDSEIRMEQLTKRRELLEQRRFELKEVTDAVVIQVLLILIRHPGSRTVDVARRLKGHSPPITIQHVRVVFDRYDLGNVGKKGGPSRH